MPRTEVWYNTHKKWSDFDPLIVFKQKQCFKCNLPFGSLTAKEIVYHYATEHRFYHGIILCDVCGLPFAGKKHVKEHKFISHAH